MNRKYVTGTTTDVFSVNRLSGEALAFPVPQKKQVVLFWKPNNLLSNYYLNKFNKMLIAGKISINDIIVLNENDSVAEIDEYFNEHKIQLLVAQYDKDQIIKSFHSENIPCLVFISKNAEVVYESFFPSLSIESTTQNFLKRD